MKFSGVLYGTQKNEYFEKISLAPKLCEMYATGLEIRGILVAKATMFSHLLPGFSSGSKHLLLP